MKQRRYNFFDTIRIPFECSPIYTIVYIAFFILLYLLPTFQIMATASFIDEALKIFHQKIEWSGIFWPILALCIIIVLSRFIVIVLDISKLKISNSVRTKFVLDMVLKKARLSYPHIENSDTWDLISRVTDQPDVAVSEALASAIKLVGIVAQICGFLLILITQAWWVAFISAIVAVPIIIWSARRGGEQYEAKKHMASYERRYKYFNNILLNRNSANERNLFHYSAKMISKWEDFYFKARKIERKVTIKWLVHMKLVSSLMSLITLTVAAAMLPLISIGTITVGLYIALVQAANNIVNLMSWDLSDNIAVFTKHIAYLRDVNKFVWLSETPEAIDLPMPATPKLHSIKFQDVTFCYPGADTAILKKVSFQIDSGQHYALVGINGAGKTTIVKLLIGLYTEFEGEILINDKSIRDYKYSELKAITAVLFQDFARYSISMHDNIALGDILHHGKKEQEAKIQNAIANFGLTDVVNSLPEGLATQLGKLHKNGQDLSGGEWQRIALSRISISTAPFCILDEPTASLDPVIESELYREFEKVSQGKTTLLISHRLGSTRIADQILVLHEGQIVEKGTYSELMDLKGHYFNMYESQRSWYQ